MDYRINNEALVACTVAQVVHHGCTSLPVVVGVTNLLLQERLRRKALKAEGYDELARIVGQLDGGLLTIIMNSLVMMIQGGCLTYHDNRLGLTDQGLKMCDEMADGKSKILTKTIGFIPKVLKKIEPVQPEALFNRYLIAL